jgi:hypothetical protein
MKNGYQREADTSTQRRTDVHGKVEVGNVVKRKLLRENKRDEVLSDILVIKNKN